MLVPVAWNAIDPAASEAAISPARSDPGKSLRRG